jgi:tetratricopeptide (TPR) repeat protein
MVTLDAPTLPRPEFTALKSSSAFDKVQRGAHLYQKGDTAGALDEYNAALEMAPDDADLRRTRALLLGDLRRYEEAIAEFDHLLSSQPRNVDLLLLKGMALYQVARFHESLTVCEEGLRLSPSDPNLHAMSGYAFESLGLLKEALGAFERSLTIKDNPLVAKARRAIVDQKLRELSDQGLGAWSGKRAQGSKNPVAVTPGPPVSDYVAEDRR